MTLIVRVVESGNRDLSSELKSHGVQTYGVVTAVSPSEHNTVSYSYSVNGRRYGPYYSDDGPQGRVDQLTVGQNIEIVYDSQDPRVSCYCYVSDIDTTSGWKSDISVGVLTASVLSTFVYIGRRNGRIGRRD